MSSSVRYLIPCTILFALLGIADIVCNVFLMPASNSLPLLASIGHFVKPALMPFLAIWAYLAWQNKAQSALWLLLAALIFSALGDTLLMLAQQDSKNLFLLGLSSFLVAHIFYIILHSRLTRPIPASKWYITRHKWVLVLALIYGAILLYVLSPFLLNTGLLLPVGVYASVLLTMALSALNRKNLVSETSFKWVFVGALSFVVSDSLIAINRFGNPFYMAGFWIMITYLFAQYSIVRGVLMADKA